MAQSDATSVQVTILDGTRVVVGGLSGDEVAAAIRARYPSAETTTLTAGPEADTPDAALLSLSVRELQVLEMIASGLLYREVAERLSLSVNSVNVYIKCAYAKIGATGATARAQAVAWAQSQGLGAK